MPAPAHAARLSTFSALKGRNYSLYWFGLVFYVLGHRAEYTTFAWITWEVTKNPMSLAYLGLAQGVPLVLFQLFGGVLADRNNRLRLLETTQTLISLNLATAFVLTALGIARLEHLLVLAALSNTFRAFDEPSRMALVPQLVERDRLPNAIALGSIPWQAGRMIGPSITGILIAAFGGSVGFGVAAAASCLALFLYSRLRLSVPVRPSDGRHVFQQFAEGLSFVGHNFVFSSLIALNTAHGAGALLGTLTVATVAHLILRRGRTLLIGAACVGAALMVFSRSQTLVLALPILVLVGFCNTFYLMQVSTYLQQHVPDHLRGRVMSLYSLCWNLLPLGGLLAGALAAAVDARFAVLFGGLMVSANALVLMLSKRLRAIS